MQIRVCRLQTGFPAADFISKFSNYLCGRINETTHHEVLAIKKKKEKEKEGWQSVFGFAR